MNRMSNAEARTYRAGEFVAFRKTGEEFGGLSNMAPGFPIRVAGVPLRTSEALYQACRFPHRPDVQKIIVSEISPMTAKMRSKPFRQDSRDHWDDIRVPIMKWCLRVKLAQNWASFGELLRRTEDKAIVEDSRKDDFWGAIRTNDGTLVGRNVLGRLLMELRRLLNEHPETLEQIEPPKLPNFTLLGKDIPAIGVEPGRTDKVYSKPARLTDAPQLWALP